MTDCDKALVTAIKAAGVARGDQPVKIAPHMLRKFHATALKMRGVPDEGLQPRIGHVAGSRMTPTIYVIPQNEDMRTGVLKLPLTVKTTA